MKVLLAAFVIALAVQANGAAASTQKTLTDGDLMGLAGNPYNSGELPLGDNHYVTDGPKKGYIYLCRTMNEGGGGAGRNGPWIHNSSWNILSKFAVQGQISWSNAQFTSSLTAKGRSLTGNGLPVSHATGIFPIQASDPVYFYDRNPNAIMPQNLNDLFPATPVYSDTPYCMDGEAGVMLTGVPLFNGFDAGMRDAPAHEVQDACSGHPQRSGQYHYHSLSACIKDIGEKTVLGYALDGFPITGPLVAPGRYLVTANLDECHGITSEIIEDGQPKTTYHYVMTQDFPYSVSCFRGKPSRTGPSNPPDNGTQNGPRQNQNGGNAPTQNETVNGVSVQRGGQNAPPQQNGGPQPGQRQTVPPEALAACNDMSEGLPCSFTSPRGDRITGACRTPPGIRTMICVPTRQGF